MLQISKLTDYATIILSYLAFNSDRIANATQIALESHLTVPTVSKILKILAAAQLVKSFRGIHGGYQLAHAAKDITLADVVMAIEGKPAMTECCIRENLCALDSLCAVKENWRVINKIILTTLANVTLSDMIRPLTGHSHALQGISVKIEDGGLHGQ